MRIRRVLIANRGEIAVRVIRTLRARGIESVAVWSEADRSALHVRLADRAVPIGPAPATESYLSIPAILAAAESAGADAVHPGYGFLSENAGFARAVGDAGLIFIGPSPEAMEALGDKAKARATAGRSGVPTVPGADAPADPAALRAAAEAIGFPLLVKAAAGGGGRGLRPVAAAGELEAAARAAEREAIQAFGDGRLILERALHPVRHVEVQVVGDGRGGVTAFPERECSLQRRHQKLIEESPSAAVGDDLRRRLLAAATTLAAAVRYAGAGTLEFLVDDSGGFYFLEMNARLQVEHPVTEAVTSEDLVDWQIEVASGAGLPRSTDALRPSGHAIEARICAEDPDLGFLPATGRILRLRLPEGPGIRVDAGILGGGEVTPHYDSLLAKIIAHGPDRETARRRLAAALRDTAVLGVTTNTGFLIDVLESPEFREARTFTHTLEGLHRARPAADVPDLVLAAAACAATLRATAAPRAGAPADPFTALGPFRLAEDTTP